VTFHDTKSYKSTDVATAMQSARRWQGIISSAMRQASDQMKDENDASNKISPATSKAVIPISVADEIKKLAELHSSGSLSLSEFHQLKSKLL